MITCLHNKIHFKNANYIKFGSTFANDFEDYCKSVENNTISFKFYY